MGTMHILDITGHTDITWDTQVEEEVAVAREEFENLLVDRCGADGGESYVTQTQ